MRSVAFSFKACAIKRAAGVLSVLALGGLAGCSSQSARFDGYGFDGGYTNASTGSLPRNAGYSDYDNGGASAGYSRSYAPSDVTRETLPPLGGAYDADDNGAGALAPGGYKSPGGFKTADGYSPLNRGYGGKGYGGRGGYDGRPTEEPPYEAPPYREEPRDGAYIQGEPGPRGGGKEIVVAPGDTLYGLALQYGVSVRDLERSNDLGGRSLRAGETIVIPSESDGGSYDRRSSYQGGGYRNGGGRDNGGYDGASYDAGAAYSASRAPLRSMSPRGEQYTVKPGDSFFTIGERYSMGPAPIAHHNKLATNATLRPGQVLLIPDEGGRHRASNDRPHSERNGAPSERFTSNESGKPARYANAAPPQGQPRETFGGSPRESHTTGQNRSDAGGAWVERPSNDRKRFGDRAPQDSAAPTQPVKVAAREPEKLDSPAPEKDPSDCEDLLANPQPRSSDTFRQPVEGLVISKFGKKDDGTINDGVNYAVPKGTPVKAAENGVVAYVGTEISGFGNLILIRHAGDYVSAYAHNDEVLVKRCEIVKRGQVVAKAGATGTVSKPQLHFELRKASKPVNPEEFFTASKE